MKKLTLICATLVVAFSTLGCASNKTLVGQTFIGDERSIKILVTKPTDSKEQIVDQYIRICNLKDGKEVDCKDTLVLQNVYAGTIR